MTDQRQQVLKVIMDHFPEAPLEDVDRELDRLFTAVFGAKIVEQFRSASRKPDKDRKGLEGAAKGLRRAEKELLKLGIHGGQAINEIVVSMKGKDLPATYRPVVPHAKSGAELAEHVGSLAEALENASRNVDLDAEHFFSNFGEDYLENTPKKEVEAQLYDACRGVFQSLSGREPKRNTDAHNAPNKNSGVFIEFTRDVFEALGLKRNSADYQMDVERKQKSP